MNSKKSDARERVRAMREEQARQERRRERIMRFGVVGAVVAAIVIIAVAVAASRGGDGPVALPDTVTEDGGGVVVGDTAAPVTIDYWMDFLCPHCKDFEDINGAAINELVESGQAKVVYHPLDYTGGVYSRRANNAFACAADEERTVDFITAAFASPQQWSGGSLVDLGESAGIEGGFESCVENDTYEDWARDVTGTAADAGVSGTPTIFVNGEELPTASWTPEGIQAAVEAAAAGGGIATSAPTETSTATP